MPSNRKRKVWGMQWVCWDSLVISPCVITVMASPAVGSGSKKPSHTLVTFGAGVAIGIVLSWWWNRASVVLATALDARLAAVQRWWPFRRHVRGKEPFKMEDHLSLVARAKRPAPLRGLIPLSHIEGMAVKSYTL